MRRTQVCLLADVIQHFVNQKLRFDCTYVYEDVQKCIKYIHTSGNLHREILSNPAKYLQKNVCSSLIICIVASATPQLYTHTMRLYKLQSRPKFLWMSSLCFTSSILVRFVNLQPKLIEMLHTLKERGKKMFILTNSPFPFVDSGMKFLFQVICLGICFL